MGHFSKEYKSPRNQKSRPRNQDISRKTVNVEDTYSKAMVAIDGAGFDWSYMADDKFQPTWLLWLSQTQRYIIAKLVLTLVLKPSMSISVDTSNEIKKAFDSSIIKDWVSNSDLDESEVMVLKSDNVQQKPKQANQPRKVSQNPRNNRSNWNEMRTQKLGVGFQFTKNACFVCGSFSHLIKDYDFHDKKMGDPQDALKDTKIFDSGCPRHIIGNKSYLIHYQEYDGGFVAFASGSQ
nr:hypothetical protein [Tanacetum cinerariifolium]